MKRLVFSIRTIQLLKLFISQNSHINFMTIDLRGEFSLKGFRLNNITVSHEELREQLKAYQRILRVTDGLSSEVLWLLLSKGCTSALAITRMSFRTFETLVNDEKRLTEEMVREIYTRAKSRRTTLVPHIMNELQNNEPHIRSAAI